MLLRGVSLAAILGLIVTASATWWVQRALSPVGDGDGDGDGGARLVAFEIEPGDTMGRVALELEAEGLIRNSRVTRWFAKVEDLGSRLKVGEYELSDAQSTPEILAVLVEGRVQTHPISIPEGLRASEIADRLAAAGLADRQAFLEVVFDPDSPTRFGVDGPSLEGYLYPDTYRFARGLPAGRVAGAMITEFLDVYHQIAPGSDGVVAQGRKLSMRGLVTLASIVEKETGVPQERPQIAAVFLNRLKRGMRLETDPTVIYGIDGFDGNLRRVHLEDSSNPYNTYRIAGLPPGPIASPGRAALEAVLAPADSPYLYFVSRNDGTHHFSKTYTEHKAAVDRFQRRRQRR